jgi:hypothetical protein
MILWRNNRTLERTPPPPFRFEPQPRAGASIVSSGLTLGGCRSVLLAIKCNFEA